jgi:hypothetical protein
MHLETKELFHQESLNILTGADAFSFLDVALASRVLDGLMPQFLSVFVPEALARNRQDLVSAAFRFQPDPDNLCFDPHRPLAGKWALRFHFSLRSGPSRQFYYRLPSAHSGIGQVDEDGTLMKREHRPHRWGRWGIKWQKMRSPDRSFRRYVTQEAWLMWLESPEYQQLQQQQSTRERALAFMAKVESVREEVRLAAQAVRQVLLTDPARLNACCGDDGHSHSSARQRRRIAERLQRETWLPRLSCPRAKSVLDDAGVDGARLRAAICEGGSDLFIAVGMVAQNAHERDNASRYLHTLHRSPDGVWLFC